VAAGLGIGGKTAVFDLSNACLGVLNGVLDVANRIELGQIQAPGWWSPARAPARSTTS
jgi:acyl-CoA:acyl-CoA alkyltransferase